MREPESDNIYTIGETVFDFSKRKLTIGSVKHNLTVKESELLKILANNLNQVIEKTAILYKIWDNDSYKAERSMNIYIGRLRKYFHEYPSIEIKNIRGIGFCLLVDEK